MAYTAPQIGVILLKADRTMYKIGQIAYENMFAEDNEALDYERDVIFIYKKAVEFADDFFVGTEKLDKVVERLATKISAYDYGELNPIYADAATVNIPSVVAGAALNDLTDVTIANLLDNQLLRYNAATGQWINVGPGSAVRSSQAFIATAGQTVFTTSAPFDAGLFDLYVNGVKLNSLSYTTFGEYQITLNDPCAAGDIVDVVIYDPNTGINPTANTLNDLTDVNIGPLVNKQALYYNSASGLWENGLVFVPYTGATAAVDLGEFEIRAGQFTLDTSPTGTATVGTTRWNDNIGSSETTLKGGSVILKNGVDLVARVVNKVTPNTTLTKASYAAVRISGAQGQRLAIAYAQANNDANSADTIGLVTETIATNQEGFIMTMGSLEGINTTGSLQGETWADGDVLYLSPTVPGGITNVKPTGLTGHIVVVGYVEYAHANNGKIYVKTMNGWELDELHNVNINTGTLANGDVLKYNSTTQLWENGVDAGGITGTGVAGQVPYFTGASAVSGSNNLFWDNTNSRLGIGTNTPAVTLDIFGNTNFKSANANNATLSVTTNTLGATLSVTGGSLNTRLLYLSPASGETRLFTSGVNSKLASYDGAGSVIYELNTSGQSYFLNNVHIGGSTNPAVKFQVTGDTLLRGSGNTSATTALTVQNSDSSNLFRVRNDGRLTIGANASAPYIQASSAGNPLLTGGNLLFYNFVAPSSSGAWWFTGDNATATSGTQIGINLEYAFTPSSGTAQYRGLQISGNINQTGGANGITRGLYVNPTLTAAADFRAIETSAGNVLFGSNFFWNNAINRLELNGTDSGDSVRIINRGFITFSDTTNTLTNRFRGVSAGFVFQDAAFNTRAQISTGSGLTYFNAAGGGVMIGTSTDLGVRLGVVGDTLLRGSGNTSATNALSVQNSDLTAIFRVRNDNRVFVTQLSFGNDYPEIFSTVSGAYDVNGGSLSFTSSQANYGVDSYNFYFRHVYSGKVFTSGTGGGILQNLGFSPTSGTGVFNQLALTGTINQTGGANGITRGLYVNPTLTAAADFRAIETTAGNVLFGASGTGFFWDNTNSRLGIGTNAPTNALHVVGNIAGFGATPLVALVPSGWGGQSLLIQSGVTQTGTTTGNYSIFKHDGASRGWAFAQGSTVCMQIAPAGNISIGTGSDLAVRLGVVGDTLLRGSGATSATTALTVQNSSSTNLFTVRNDGLVTQSFNQNGTTAFNITNTTSGTAADARITFAPNAGTFSVGKYSTSTTSYKILSASDCFFYNGFNGDFSILNDFASGQIKFAAGGASSPHLTIKSNGRINISSLPTSSTGLVAGDLWNDAGTVKIV